MPEIRRITTEREQQAFGEMQHYCFQGGAGQDMFPLKRGAVAWGEFCGDDLQAGIVEIPFETHMLGAQVKMLGIGGVVSLPQARNGGAVRRLHARVLSEGKMTGYGTSALYPFSFSFYEKFGYGNIGPCFRNSFAPESIDVDAPPPKHTIASPTPKQAAMDVEPWWSPLFWSAYDFSNARDTAGLGELFERRVGKGSYIRTCVDESGATAGLVVYRISTSGQYSQILNVGRMAWRDGDAFRSLMRFLWSHRGQCESIELSWPYENFLPAALKEPRFKRTPSYAWMARPIDILSILKLKTSASAFDGSVRLAIEDPSIPENTGTYEINAGNVSFHEGIEGIPLPFPVFSSLLFGAITPYETSLITRLPFDLDTAGRLFQTRPIFMTDEF